MQQTFYKLSFSLNKPLPEKRLEMLEKIEAFKKELKQRGHTGRYGLNNLVCYSSLLTSATCIASINHADDAAWLNYEIERMQDSERARIKTKRKHIEEQERAFSKIKDDEAKIAYLKALSPNDLKRLDITKEQLSGLLETPDEFHTHLKTIEESPSTFLGFKTDPLWIEPVVPSQKELKIERDFLENLPPKELRILSEKQLLKAKQIRFQK